MPSLVLVLCVVGVAFASPWDAQNNPAIFGNYTYTFKALPTRGRTANSPWSDTCKRDAQRT